MVGESHRPAEVGESPTGGTERFVCETLLNGFARFSADVMVKSVNDQGRLS